MKMRFKVGDIDSLLNISFNFELIFFLKKKSIHIIVYEICWHKYPWNL